MEFIRFRYPKTVGSFVYFFTFVVVSLYLLSHYAVYRHAYVSCKGVSDEYRSTICLESYDKGPNDLSRWFILTTVAGPFIIMFVFDPLIYGKRILLGINNCIVHIHQLYFLEGFLLLLFHSVVQLILVIRIAAYGIGQVTLTGTYRCLIGNSTLACTDSSAKEKSEGNIVCCSLNGFLFMLTNLELWYYGYKWKRSKEGRNRLSHVSNVCKECKYFIRNFTISSELFTSREYDRRREVIPLYSYSEAGASNDEMPSVHALYKPTAIYRDEEKEQMQKAEIDKIKETYKQLYKTHEIQVVDENDRIVLKEVDVSDFAVQLKIDRCFEPEDTFGNEAYSHLEDLRTSFTGDGIDISNLIDGNHRVNLICGMAGIGKSVLSKQLTYGWANGEIYQNFNLCIMFKYRDLSDFKDRKGADLNEHEVLAEFLKGIVNFDLGDGEGTLFIVDGLDELYDITGEDSIIFDLLNIKGKYDRAKVIITGRPQIRDRLQGYRNVGGLKTVEIQGLTNDQIDIYIEKFAKREHHILDINKTKDASDIPLIHVPQFLNTLCCIAVLLKGQEISNSTELYCWTVFLLLKQHADKHDSSRKRASEVFSNFSQTLLKLGELCHGLLKRNKIVFEGSVELLLGDIGEDKEFVDNLFLDVSDDITEKYQFKDVPLMEFLSALYICKQDRKVLMEVVEETLERGFTEVVSFVCRLISGFSYGGIITEIIKNVAGLRAEVNEKQFLSDVTALLWKCKLNEKTKLRMSFEVMTFFLNKIFHDKEFSSLIIARCSYMGFGSDVNTSENVGKICRHLQSCGWKEGDIRMAFANVQFGLFNVSNLETLRCTVKALKIFCIVLHDTKTTVDTVQRTLDGYSGRVVMEDCELEHDEIENVRLAETLTELVVTRCIMKNANSFSSLCHWGMSCQWFYLWNLVIHYEWWEILVSTIESTKTIWYLRKGGLDIRNSTTQMSPDLVKRVLQCGMRLSIDGKDFFDESSKKYLLENVLTPSTGRFSTRKHNHPSPTLPESSLEHRFEPVLTVPTHASSESVTTHLYKDDTRKERFVFDSSGGSLESHTLSLSLDVPENSVDSEIYLDISSVEMSTIPPITFEFGETAVGDVINMIPSGIQFKKPATLTVRHSVVDLPELSSIVVKFYDHEKENWIALPRDTDDENQDAMAISAEISVSSFYVLCMSLDSMTYTIPKAGLSFSPFDSKYDVKLIFEEGTFGDESALVQLKMNVFSEEARTELKRFGLKPFPILHVSEISMRQPVKPVTLKLRMNGRIQTDETFFILYGDDHDFRDETGSIQYKIGKNFISIQLTHFSKVGGIIANFGQWTFEQAQKLLKIFSGPRYLVTFGLFCKPINDIYYSCHVACRRANRPQECGELIENGYSRLESFQARLHSRTEMRVDVTGDYKTETSTTKFTFIQGSCTYTSPFRIVQSTEEASSNNCSLLVYKNNDQLPFEIVPFSVTRQGPPRQIPRDEHIGGSQQYPGGNDNERASNRDLQPTIPTASTSTTSESRVSQQSLAGENITNESSIEAILDDWNLLTEIAELLEQGSGIALQNLALRFDIAEPLQLTSVEPSERFFHNLARNNGGIKLADLKKFIEVDCNLQNKSIFPPIERAITQGIVDFTLESTLATLKGRNWSYFLKYVADKLLENTFQLPSWKNIASHYKYTANIIESFCTNVKERPTVRLFQHLRCMEDVPTISTLKICLKEIQRNDIVKLLNKRLPMTNQ